MIRLNKSIGNITAFEPKLIFLVNSNNGIPIDACLSSETRAYLQCLTVNEEHCVQNGKSVSADRQVPEKENGFGIKSGRITLYRIQAEGSCHVNGASTEVRDRDNSHQVEVPLRHDHEFFQMLRSGVSGLDNLQKGEEAELVKEIGSIGQEIAKIAAPSQSPARTDMYAWREIFSLYIDSQVFFSTSEQDRCARDTRMAEKQLQQFSSRLRGVNATQGFRRKESPLVLDRFLQLNLVLLRNLRFQELNTTAMTKIMKSK